MSILRIRLVMQKIQNNGLYSTIARSFTYSVSTSFKLHFTKKVNGFGANNLNKIVSTMDDLSIRLVKVKGYCMELQSEYTKLSTLVEKMYERERSEIYRKNEF